MSEIVLVTLNARYAHCSLGLRYLLANLGELERRASLLELTIQDRPSDVVEKILARKPRIVGFGVYVWNATETERVVSLLKRVKPEVRVVLGGPEISHETERQTIAELADYVITGAADLAFAELCRSILTEAAPTEKILHPEPPAPERIAFPYRRYTESDIAHRVIYVEASRGCPFRCAFCLSALDRTALPFPVEPFLAELEGLWKRGARQFKFVDRTFNLRLDLARSVLEFFLARTSERPFLHFEMIPDRLPERLREPIGRFPPGTLQLEIGIQTFNPAVQELIGRRQDPLATEANLQWLQEHSHAHLHTDLIFGLPGEDLQSLSAGFDRLVSLGPHEIQVGILKRLRGTPLCRLADARDMIFSPYPPYPVLATDRLDFETLQRLGRFARFWDLVGNSGRFLHSLPLLIGERPFARFLSVSDWLYAEVGQTHAIALERLAGLVEIALQETLGVPRHIVSEAIGKDRAGWRDRRLAARGKEGTSPAAGNATPDRQLRHRRGRGPGE